MRRMPAIAEEIGKTQPMWGDVPTDLQAFQPGVLGSEPAAAARGSGARSAEQPAERPARFTTPESCPALVLNADYQPLSYMPLSLWSWSDAVKAVVAGRVHVVEEHSCTVRSPNMVMPIPSVIALKEYVAKGNGGVPNFTRRNLFLRDAYQCQYCGAAHVAKDLTMDHVVPRARGGGTSWDNVVSACGPCNNRKGDKSVKEIARSLGMHLRTVPTKPTHYELQMHARKFPPKLMHETWENYLSLSPQYQKGKQRSDEETER